MKLWCENGWVGHKLSRWVVGVGFCKGFRLPKQSRTIPKNRPAIFLLVVCCSCLCLFCCALFCGGIDWIWLGLLRRCLGWCLCWFELFGSCWVSLWVNDVVVAAWKRVKRVSAKLKWLNRFSGCLTVRGKATHPTSDIYLPFLAAFSSIAAKRLAMCWCNSSRFSQKNFSNFASE